jgi:hypothetical protein
MITITSFHCGTLKTVKIEIETSIVENLLGKSRISPTVDAVKCYQSDNTIS